MEIIRFRAFHKIRKEMYNVHGWHSEFVFKDTLDGIGCDGNPDKLEDVELMQFVNNKVNGKDLYVGDIVRVFSTSDCPSSQFDYLLVIQFGYFNKGRDAYSATKGFGAFKLTDGKISHNAHTGLCFIENSYAHVNFEIIGNIYDNPELLQ